MKIHKFRLLLSGLIACLAISGCEGTESREQVDDTVKELSGKKSLDHMERMKEDIGDITKKQADRLKEPQ